LSAYIRIRKAYDKLEKLKAVSDTKGPQAQWGTYLRQLHFNPPLWMGWTRSRPKANL